VDGNQSYAGAKLDFQNCDTFLEVGGFILFDDSTLKSFGVHQLMPEILATRRYQLAAKNPNHLFKKIRRILFLVQQTYGACIRFSWQMTVPATR
jgi:hypothetical protein